MSLLIDTANAVMHTINSGDDYTLPFTAKVMFLPKHEPNDLKVLQVTVVPVANSITKIGRGQVNNENDVSINVGIQKIIESDADIVALHELAEEIIKFMTHTRLVDQPNISWYKTDHTVTYGTETLDDMDVFVSVLTLQYKAMQ